MGTAALGCPGEQSSPAAGTAQFPSWESTLQYRTESSLALIVQLYNEKPAGLCPAGQPKAAVPTWFVPMPQAFYRRQLPHLQADFKPHFVTFCTDRRWILPQSVRSIVLECCLHDNGKNFDLKVALVMPDHAHLIFTPLIDYEEGEVCSLARIMDAIKGSSAHKINKTLHRKGRVWQPESFDHVLRCSENLDATIQYLLENPIRQGLARDWHDYPWLWQKEFVNPFAPSSAG